MAKVLLCYLAHYSGHHAAALAVEEALHRLDPSVETLCVDLLGYTHPRWSAVIQRTYMVTIRRTPELWEVLYDSAWVEWLTRKIRVLIQRGNSRPLLQLMDDFRPDAAVCTQAHPLAVLSAYAARHRRRLPLWGVVTDYVPHRFWVAKGPITYVVPTEAAADRLVWLGIPREAIRVYGIPVRVRVAAEPQVTRAEPPRVLVMGGSRGLGVRYRTVRYLDQSPAAFTIDVISGTNQRLRRRLVGARGSFRHPIRVRGYVHDAAALMQRATLLLSKPGGATSAEAMALGLPMLIVRPLPGQERNNTDVLVGAGAALHLEQEREVPEVVTRLLSQPELLERMRERARALGRPEAALRVAEDILRAIK